MNGELTDFRASEDSARTPVRRDKVKLSACELKDADRIVNVSNLSESGFVYKPGCCREK